MKSVVDRDSSPTMRARSSARRLVLLPLLSSLAFACATGNPANAVHEKNEQLVERAAKGDVAALVRDFYAAEPIVAFGPKVSRGHKEAAALWKELLAEGTLEIETERLETSCDLASETGGWTLRVKADEGDYREEKGRYYVTWKKEAGQWKAVMQTFTPEGFHEAE